MEHADSPAAGLPLGRVLARLFIEFADLIEIEGSDPRKASAYRRAALALRNSAEPVETLAAEGRLTSIPGIGPVLAAKIGEYARSGRIEALEALRAQVPAGVAGMLAIRGVGPKFVASVWRGLGITSVEALRAAAADGRLAALAGVGAARAAKVAQAILAATSALRLLGEVLPLSAAIAAALTDAPGVHRASIAGAVRRGCPLVPTADLVAAGDAAAVGTALAALALPWSAAPEHVAGDGPWPEIRGTIADGPDVRVIVCPPAAFGTALLLATGAEDHLAELAAWRRARGEANTPWPAAGDEEGAYRGLGLPWIPPELREGRGEVQAAAEGRLPARLVELRDLQGDVHCHSTFSDGTASVEAMAAAARAHGYRYLSLADHSRSLVVAHGMSVEALREQRRRIDAINAASTDGFVLLQGAEVEILRDGSLDYPDEILEGLDFCVVSLHNPYGQSETELTARMRHALEHPAADLLGHPTGRRLGKRDPYPVDVPALVAAAAACGKAIEVNGSPERLDLDGTYNRLLPPAGVIASLDSDAHSAAGLGGAEYAVITARRGGLTAADVLNTRPLEGLRAWKSGRR